MAFPNSPNTFTKTPPESEWEEHVHPNGGKYLYHPGLRVLSKTSRKVNIPNDLKLGSTFDIQLDENGHINLFVNHQESAKTADHDGLRRCYWHFMCDFPSHRPLRDCGANEYGHAGLTSFDCDAFHAAKQVLNFFKMDLLRRRSDSEAPFTLEQCKELLECLDTYEDPKHITFLDVPSQSSALTALVSWVLWTAMKHKIRHDFGGYMIGKGRHQLQPKLEVDRTTVLFHIISSVFLLGAPELQDRTDSWTSFLRQFDQELTVSNLGSTVLLSSSSAFLAVPGIDKVTRIVTLVSVALTLGSVTTGIYLQWQTGKLRFKDIDINHKALALVFSIPFVALVWAIILFTVAVIAYSILGTLDPPNETFGSATWIPTLVVSCVFVVIVGVLVLIFRVVRYKHDAKEARQLEV
ncbi:hypothetical protein BDP27DRAFT_1324080 [Rhodocollybia butyracea]|uniref:Uncharacterized protein n=1 Tax=Rhodocollybia butyracea TaxID=206335 RepID=A0A9P5PXF2_9AGAR|nr:hypothetical protein BDP27DRAFT_1324080 [Rhodocollybia butyracea]